jgi:type III restriction enzyme
VATAIRTTTIEEMVKHITYEPIVESEWWDAEVVFVEAETVNFGSDDEDDPSRGLLTAPEGGANLFDHVVYDSHVERKFAALLENDHEHVKLFTKLPRRFRVRTPVGEYSPDWGIVFEEDGVTRLYLVRETKDTLNLDDLDWDEAMRIRFARRHFAAAPSPVDYNFTTDVEGLRVSVEWDEHTA